MTCKLNCDIDIEIKTSDNSWSCFASTSGDQSKVAKCVIHVLWKKTAVIFALSSFFCHNVYIYIALIKKYLHCIHIASLFVSIQHAFLVFVQHIYNQTDAEAFTVHRCSGFGLLILKDLRQHRIAYLNLLLSPGLTPSCCVYSPRGWPTK